MPLISLPRPSARGTHSTPNSRVSSHSTAVAATACSAPRTCAQAGGVQRAPLAVADGAGDPGDLVVDVILRVAVPAGALQPRRHDQPGRLEPARLLAVDPGPVVAGPGDPGPGLHVLQRGPVRRLQTSWNRSSLAPGPVRPRPARRRPAGPGARSPGSRRAAPRSTWRTRPSRRCRRRAAGSPGRPPAPARSAARRWRAARRPAAAPGGRRTSRSCRGTGRASPRCAGRVCW